MPRLDQLLARNTHYSRAEVRQLLRSGAVSSQSGATLDKADEWLEPAVLPVSVCVREREVVLHDSSHVLLNKPPGCVTALKDRDHPVAYDFLTGAPLKDELRPVGRLDLDTTGLLLWTTDGGWLQRLSHPRRKVPRTYHAALSQPFLPPPSGLTLADGHQPNITQLREIDGRGAHPSLVRPDGVTVFASITITGGAYHEVKRIFAALGSHVAALCRVSFGNLLLPEDLAFGQHRPVRPEDVLSE
jgi:16S rRNA pseudouridine516 synthase